MSNLNPFHFYFNGSWPVLSVEQIDLFVKIGRSNAPISFSILSFISHIKHRENARTCMASYDSTNVIDQYLLNSHLLFY